MSKVKVIGVIAEDDSDYEVVKILINRITGKDNIAYKKAIGNGCGKVKHKALKFITNLQIRGCNMAILMHDLDKNDLTTLKSELEKKLIHSPLKNYFICIPIEEIEAWFLSDPEGIKNAMSLQRIPNIKQLPETIKSPKEKLEYYVQSFSNNEKVYLNTKHNSIIAKVVSLDLMKQKCQSFKNFFDFVKTQKY